MSHNNIIDECLNLICDCNYKVCQYGLGMLGKNAAQCFLDILGLQANYVSDGDIRKLEEVDCGSCIKVSKEELINKSENIVVFLFVGIYITEEIVNELKANKRLVFVRWADMIVYDPILKSYLGIENFTYSFQPDNITHFYNPSEREKKRNPNAKVAVYTCITGGYDLVPKHFFINPGFDYYLITDIENNMTITDEEYYHIMQVRDVCPSYITSSKEQNRYCKMHGYEIFPEYDYCIYLDGNISISKDMKELIDAIGDYGIAFHQHPISEDSYSEALIMAVKGRISVEEAVDTAKEMLCEGYPRHYGLLEAGVIIYDIANPIAKKILKNWYKNYKILPAKRDQIALSYTLWQLGIPVQDLSVLPGNWRTNGYFKMMSRHSGFQK